MEDAEMDIATIFDHFIILDLQVTLVAMLLPSILGAPACPTGSVYNARLDNRPIHLSLL